MISSVVLPSISLSGVRITLCLSTGLLRNLISSGVTKSLPLMIASALEAFSKAMEALGDAPSYREGFSLVSATI